MTGILRKDFYMLMGAYKRSLLLTLLLYGVLSVVTGNPFFPAMMVWMMGFCSLSAITMDESDGWDRYARTLPVSPGRIVAARCLAALGMVVLGVVYALILGLFCREDPTAWLSTVALATGAALLSMGILFPAAYKWGVEKARSGFLIVFLVIFVMPFVARKVIDRQSFQSVIDGLDAMQLPWLALAALGAGLLVFVLGGLLTCRIYRRKEF